MYRDKKIALVIPAYNEEKLIVDTLRSVPPLVDRIYVADDASPDRLAEVVLGIAKTDPRVNLLRHKTNLGPGAGIITGYRQSAADGCDITLVVGGDNQMLLSEAAHFLDPLVDGTADYAKGNRFLDANLEDTLSKMPPIRLFGNWLITALTKIASGYYKTMDVVDGYTAITRRAIETINWSRAWQGYGYPMDFLVRLNAYGFRLIDIPRTAVYLPGERQSQIKGFNYALKVTPMLVRDFFWRLNFKYMYRDFHPLVFFYYLGLILLPAGFLSGLYLVYDKIIRGGYAVTAPRSILVALMVISGVQFLLFAMLFDMEQANQK
ncbi:MAG TPA: glycosyltransferase family 2 protein [Elusimicrobia bacterium]|nr:glycosyltransferase family 2 protein [Elusimicrobiota bacterium]